MTRQTRRPLTPLHPSIRGLNRTPLEMSSVVLDNETLEALTGIALSIFTDCANAGKTFQEALLAVYISGVEHGSQASH